jgi:lactoylglutathione lyase
MERLPSPDFDIHVEWLRLGDQQLHLFVRETATPPYHHIGLDVDDFKAAFVMAPDRGLLDDALGPPGARAHRRLGTDVSPRPRGQPRRGRLPDASTLDREVVGEIALLADERPQSDEARRTRLYLAPAAPGQHFR